MSKCEHCNKEYEGLGVNSTLGSCCSNDCSLQMALLGYARYPDEWRIKLNPVRINTVSFDEFNFDFSKLITLS